MTARMLCLEDDEPPDPRASSSRLSTDPANVQDDGPVATLNLNGFSAAMGCYP